MAVPIATLNHTQQKKSRRSGAERSCVFTDTDSETENVAVRIGFVKVCFV